MSSSFRLQRRYEEARQHGWWQFGDTFDHYLREWGDCHPDYYTIPIGNPDGVKVCVRKNSEYIAQGNATRQYDAPGPPHRRGPEGAQLSLTRPPPPEDAIETWDVDESPAYYKYSSDLYNPTRRVADQMYNPYLYANRRPPDQEYNLSNDLIRIPIRFNGTGVEPMRTPGTKPGDGPFYEYGYDYVREAPPAWDRTQLHQRRPVWDRRQAYLREGEARDAALRDAYGP